MDFTLNKPKFLVSMKSMISFPLVRIVFAFLIVTVSAVLAQTLVLALPLDEMGRNILVMFVVVPVVVGVYSLYVRWAERRPVTEFSLQGAAAEMGKGLLLGVALFSATIGVLALLGSYTVSGINTWNVVILPLSASVLTGFLEEVLMRGILFRVIEDSLGTWIALAISAGIFGLLHLFNENATLVGALGLILEAGVLLAAAYIFTRRLWFAIGIHIAWNFTQAGIFGVVVSGNEAIPGLLRSSLQGPDWLSGGTFGAEASLVAVAICLTVGIYLVVQAVRKGNIIPPFWARER